MRSKHDETSGAWPDDSWALHSDERQPWLRGYLGNGRLAVQLVADGGLAGSQGQPLHQMAELYDRAEGYEVEHPVPLPGWSGLRLKVDGMRLGPDAAASYRQNLDLRRGVAVTQWLWRLGAGDLSVTSLQAVLRNEPNLALIRLTIRATWETTVEVTSAFHPYAERACYVELDAGSADEAILWSTGCTRIRKVPVALAGMLLSRDRARTMENGASTCQMRLKPNGPEEVDWLVAVHCGAGALEVAIFDTQRGAASGVDQLLAGHIDAWNELWKSDIRIDGDREVQYFARAGLFALMCSARADIPASIAPMGLSSLGYNGHIFWDADTWMFPPLLLLQPEIASSMLAYRQNRLERARVRARAEGYRGAMFPWESATDGDETTPPVARTGLKEHHITACVALAHWQYYLATLDNAWLLERGWPVLEAAAEFWVSRAVRTERGYEICDVIAADEYAEDVDNDAFTNGAARGALLAAIAAARIVGRDAPQDWSAVAHGLVLAREGDHILEFDGYDGRVIKQGDVELLTFPLEYPLCETTIAKNLDVYYRLTDIEGPAMGRSISAVVAAQLGRRDEARSLFAASYEPNLCGPYYSLAETRSNGEVNFLTGVGGALQTLLFGFAGLRFHREALAVDPLLPAGWHGLHFPALHWRGQTLSLSVLPGDRLELTVRDAGVPLTLILHRWRPGPAPLTVEVNVGEGVGCTLDADGWSVMPSGGGCAWRLCPATHNITLPFVLLRATVIGPDGPFTVKLEQRVSNGDA